MTRRRTIITAAILAGTLGLTACGTNREEGQGEGGGGTTAGACDTSKGTLIVGMVAPLSGGLSALGLGMRNSAQLAVDQANEACKVPGYELAFQPEDDQVPEELRGIGVRIEDDVLVTPDGPKILSDGLPRTADDVEAWLADQRAKGPRLPGQVPD